MKQLYILLFLFVSSISVSQIITIPDANFKAKLLAANTTNQIASSTINSFTPMVIDTNGNGEIEVSEALLVKWLNVLGSSIASLEGIQYFTNLKDFRCNNNSNLTSLDLGEIMTLTYLECSGNAISSINMNENDLLEIAAGYNQLDNIDFLQNANSIIDLSVEENLLNSIDVSSFLTLKRLRCSYNNLSALDISMLSLTNLDCSNNQITSLLLSSNMTGIDFSNNLLTSIDLTGQNNPSLSYLNIANNLFSTFTFPNLDTYYLQLDISGNLYTSIDLQPIAGNNNYLREIIVLNTKLTSLDLSFPLSIYSLVYNNQDLVSLNLKNGSFDGCQSFPTEFCFTSPIYTASNNPNLQFLCVDENEVELYMTNQELANTFISSYCSYTPGGSYNTISGNIKLDNDSNGCDANDVSAISIPVKITFSVFSYGSSYTNQNGDYVVYVPSYDRVFTPYFQNPYYIVSPNNFTYNYTTANDIETANFCISPNGVHPDLEISILPISPARPGFDATYKIIFKNKGTETQSGTVGFTFMDTVLDIVSSNPIVSLQEGNTLSWGFVDLLPFESREITVVLNVNSPMEIPAVNNDDILNFSVSIVSALTDETPNDNQMDFNQMVVGSYDPNDKTVLQGSQIDISKIGDYLYYIVRFQNTGTYAAEKVVVKDFLDIKLDRSSLQMVSSSHSYRSSLTEGDKLEVFYEGINLPPSSEDEAGSNGYFSFKIKPKSNVVLNDVIENTAYIYFDFNFPIITNTVSTAFSNLSNTNFDRNELFTLFPNPTKNSININLLSENEIQICVIYNLLGQKLISSKSQKTIDVSSLQKGTYLIEVETSQGNQTKKFIKI